MATTLAEILFWVAVSCIALSQALILRSTRRGMRHGPRRAAAPLEWAYAVLPGIALALVLVWTWRTMHNATVHFESRPPDEVGIHS